MDEVRKFQIGIYGWDYYKVYRDSKVVFETNNIWELEKFLGKKLEDIEIKGTVER